MKPAVAAVAVAVGAAVGVAGGLAAYERYRPMPTPSPRPATSSPAPGPTRTIGERNVMGDPSMDVLGIRNRNVSTDEGNGPVLVCQRESAASAAGLLGVVQSRIEGSGHVYQWAAELASENDTDRLYSAVTGWITDCRDWAQRGGKGTLMVAKPVSLDPATTGSRATLWWRISGTDRQGKPVDVALTVIRIDRRVCMVEATMSPFLDVAGAQALAARAETVLAG